MSGSSAGLEVRGVLLPLDTGQLLLPNATVSEVVAFSEPEPVQGEQPDWLLGMVQWRSHSLPLVSFDALLGREEDATGHRARIAIVNTLNGNSELPFIGIRLRSVPHLAQASPETVMPIGAQGDMGELVAQQVRINAQEAWIPDLDALERVVADTLAQVAGEDG